MKYLARALLGIMTVAIPVFIAACYGVPYRFLRGRVVDKTTKSGVKGVTVTCKSSAGGAEATAVSNDDGSFALRWRTPCASVDAAAPGGYQTVSLPVAAGKEDADLTVELEKTP